LERKGSPHIEYTMTSSVRFGFDNTYARLPMRFYARVNPAHVAKPRLIKVNAALAESLGIDPRQLASAEGVEILAGNRVAEGSEPLAIAYAGHQFGHFVPQLGDGRANLLGEVKGYDIQLKGSGPTPFSRRGDGRAAARVRGKRGDGRSRPAHHARARRGHYGRTGLS
jgi:uncharacterized protein YdiU (UPF0061 family)